MLSTTLATATTDAAALENNYAKLTAAFAAYKLAHPPTTPPTDTRKTLSFDFGQDAPAPGWLATPGATGNRYAMPFPAPDDTGLWGQPGVATGAGPAFALPLPTGRWIGTLRTAEGAFSAAGKRVMHVVFDGRPLEINIDIFARVGQGKLLTLGPYVFDSDGDVALTLPASVDNGCVLSGTFVPCDVEHNPLSPVLTLPTAPPVVVAPPDPIAPGTYPQGTTPRPWTPRSAETYRRMFAAATHLPYVNEAGYGNVAVLGDVIRDLGLTVIRDGWSETPGFWNGTGATQMWQRMRAINAASGARLIYGFTPYDGPFTLERWTKILQDSMATIVATGSQDLVVGVEGMNEPGGWDPGAVGSLFAEFMRSAVYATTIKAALPGVPLLGLSLADATTLAKAAAIGPLPVDYGVTHDYPGDAFILTDAALAAVKAAAGKMAPGKPVAATETGYTNGHANAMHTPSSEADAARRHTVLAAEHQRAGFVWHTIYDLMNDNEGENDDFQGDHGLVAWTSNPDGSLTLRRKPAFTAIKNQIACLKAAGSPQLNPLGCSISGDGPNTRADLHRRGDGAYVVSLWEQSVATPGPTVTVHLDRARPVNVHRPVTGAVIARGAPQSFAVASLTELTMIEIGG